MNKVSERSKDCAGRCRIDGVCRTREAQEVPPLEKISIAAELDKAITGWMRFVRCLQQV